MLGSLGFAEIAFILVLALLIFGPKRLPDAGKALGKAMGEFRRASNELRRTFNTELSLEEDEHQPAPRRLPISPSKASSPAEIQPPETRADGPSPSQPPGAVARGDAPGAADTSADTAAEAPASETSKDGNEA